MTVLPSFKFDTADFAEQDRFDAVSDLWRNYLTFNFSSVSKRSFFLRSAVWWLNDCTFVHSIAAPMGCCSRPAPTGEESLISISFLQNGQQNYVVSGSLRRQCADAIHVSRHCDQSIRQCPTDSDIFILYVPAGRLGLLPNEHFPSRTIPTVTPVGAMIRSMLLSLPQSLSHCTKEEGAVLADSLCAFLKPVLHYPADIEATDVAEFRYAAIQRYIEENIKDPALGSEKLCNAFGVSRPTLYRLFKDTGGVMAYIAQRRTHHVYAELSRLSPRWGLIRTVAEKFGFHDMTQFTRTFRKHVGMNPGNIVGTALANMPAVEALVNTEAARPELLTEPLVLSRLAQSTHAARKRV